MLPYGCIMPFYFMGTSRCSADAFESFSYRNMSSNNNTAFLVPILDGTNYRQQAVAIKALIQSTGMQAYVQGKVTREYFSKNKAKYKALPTT